MSPEVGKCLGPGEPAGGWYGLGKWARGKQCYMRLVAWGPDPVGEFPANTVVERFGLCGHMGWGLGPCPSCATLGQSALSEPQLF